MSQSCRSHTFCKFNCTYNYVCFVYFAAIAQLWKNLHRQHVMSFIQSWCGRERRRSRDEKGNQGFGDFRLINILQLSSIYFVFSITFTLSFFSIHFLSTTFTHTHNHDPRHLAGSAWQGKTTTVHVHHAFLYISLPSLHNYHVKMPNFTFCGGRKQAKQWQNFLSLSKLGYGW